MQRKDCDTIKRSFRQAMVWLVLASLIFTTSARAGSLVMWPEAVVTGEDVRVSDVCRLRQMKSAQRTRLAEIVVKTSPTAGGSIIVTMHDLRRALTDAKVNLAAVVLKGAAHCDVRRPVSAEAKSASPIEPSTTSAKSGAPSRTLREAIHDFMRDDFGSTHGRIELQFGRLASSVLELREPDFQFDIKRTTASRLGLVGLEVTVLASGEEVQNVPFMVNVSHVRPVVVAARAINAGATVGTSDVRVMEMTFARAEPMGADSPDAVVGQRAKKFIPAGELVRQRDLEPVPLVKRGQIVSVFSQAGGVSVTSAAKALTSGVFGDVIELRSSERSKRRITATVTGPGRVRVGGASADLAMGGAR